MTSSHPVTSPPSIQSTSLRLPKMEPLVSGIIRLRPVQPDGSAVGTSSPGRQTAPGVEVAPSPLLPAVAPPAPASSVPNITMSNDEFKKFKENIMDVQACRERFCETGEIDALEYAIEIIDGMISESHDKVELVHFLRCILSRLTELKPISNTLTPIVQPTNPAPEVVPATILGAAESLATLMTNGVIHSDVLAAVEKAVEVVKDLEAQFNTTGDINYLNSAITGLERIIKPNYPNELNVILQYGMSEFFQAKYQHTNDIDDLEQGIQASRKVLALTPLQDPGRSDILNHLTKQHIVKFERGADFGDLDNAIRAGTDAVAATARSNPDRADRLCTLSDLLFTRFTKTGTVVDLHQAIQNIKELVVRTALDDPNREGRIETLMEYVGARFERLGEVADLEDLIREGQRAVSSIADGHPDSARRFNNLAGYHSFRFQRFGVLGDLDESVRLLHKAEAATTPDHPLRQGIMSNLGSILETRFERFGIISDLDGASEANEEALAESPGDRLLHSGILNQQATGLHRRYKQFNSLDDLETGIQILEKVVATTPQGHVDRAMGLRNLVGLLSHKYERLGTLADLDYAIEVGLKAVEETPLDHPLRGARLNTLSNVFRRRSVRLGSLNDFQKSIRASEEAVAATPVDPTRPYHLSVLSERLFCRFLRFEVPDDLEKALRTIKEAFEGIPIDDQYRAPMLYHLGCVLAHRFQSSGAPEDLERGITMIEEALAVGEEHRFDRRRMMAGLGTFLYKRFEVSGDLQDLDKGIRAFDQSISQDIWPRSGTFLSLADGHYSRFLHTRSEADVQLSLEYALQCWHCTPAPPALRINAARLAAKCLAFTCSWEEASNILEGAVKLLPSVSHQLLRRNDQEYQLKQFAQLAADTVSTALQSGGTAAHCLAPMELSRGIIMGRMINFRNFVYELEDHYPDIHTKYSQLRDEIDYPFMAAAPDPESLHSGSTYESGRRRRVQAIQEIDEILISIRQLPNFERFQLPPDYQELITLAAEGPIVIFNSTPIRSDAIIVTNSVIKSLILPKLVFAEAQDRIVQLSGLSRGKRSTYPSRNVAMGKILLWLWEVAVQPVLEELGFGAFRDVEVDSSRPELPRVWWIGVGILATAPFHAAGDHSPGSKDNTISRAISSYIPTIQALSFVRERTMDLMLSDLLFITMPTTPDTPATPEIPAVPGTPATAPTADNPGTPAVDPSSAVPATPAKHWRPVEQTTEEIWEIIEIVEERNRADRIVSPNVQKVITLIPLYDVIHFAGHAVSNNLNPSNSHLLLHGINGPEKLTAGVISSMSLKSARIAYLSACCTAENPSAELADEAIHIASAFLLAGFSHVLATLWDSADGSCRRVARKFYRALFIDRHNGAVVVGHRAVSAAMHYSVMQLRQDILTQPLMWASFIHTGA